MKAPKNTIKNSPKDNSLPSLDTPEAIVNLYKMLGMLTSYSEQDMPDRFRGMTYEGRQDLCDDYTVPWKENGDPGHLFVYYPDEKNYLAYLNQQTNNSKKTFVGKPFDPTIEEFDGGDWFGSELYNFLKSVSRDKALATEFYQVFETGDPQEQTAFLEQYLPMNHYKEWEAIMSLMNPPPDDNPLAQSTVLLFTSASNHWGWC